jgi:phosphoenolpyruvate phosphomutase
MSSTKNEKIVYVAMAVDFLHMGHIKIINEAKKYGKVIVGLLTDEAIASYKRVPMTSYEQRKKIMENIVGVSKIIPQHTLDYTENLKKIKPDFVVHGDDWKRGVQKEIRNKVIETIKEWKGQLIEPPYTEGISSSMLIKDQMDGGVTTEFRRKQLKRLIELKPIVRVIEAHNGLSARIAETTKMTIHNEVREFDAIWESSLTDSSSKGKPDIEVVDLTSRTQTINEILEVTTKPIIVDGDTGGLIEHFVFMVKTLERLGVSAVIIEDKKFPKRNSLLEGATHIQEDIDKFCNKIRAGIQARVTQDFMIIARIESLIAGKSVADAIIRANAYIEAGADAIMIHSKNKNPVNLIEFCRQYRSLKNKVPLVVVPTTYNQLTEDELEELGASIVIYANHLLRASYNAMRHVAETILEHKRSLETDTICLPIKEVLSLLPQNGFR